MGNTKSPVASKRKKKKGRPSLLDLQRRSLRLQRDEQPEEEIKQRNRSPVDDLRRPSSRRKLDPATEVAAAADDDEDDEDEDHSGRRRREKKLRLVLRLPNNPSADSVASGSESDSHRTGKIGPDGTDAQAEGENSAWKATDLPQDSGPSTPLPDKKLLIFILDRLQKKDTYGVFAEPVDPEELPDYHEIIEHPMDFATIREKLSSGAYANLEQFENDVFLVSSNAMRYNSPDTIYYRQARSIQELAKKSFENLRQESDDNETEPKPVRRGRPPLKNILKKVGRPPADRADSNLSSNALANGGDNNLWVNTSHGLSRKGLDKSNLSELPTKYGLRSVESHNLSGDHKSERNEDNSGSALKCASTKYLKKSFVIDENRRNTYNQSQVLSSSIGEPSVLTTFDGGRKQLVPVGLFMEHAYARSLARFAAKLGPVGWEIAARRIEHALPPGTKFGRGWVGDDEAPQQSQPPLLSSSPSHSSQPENTPNTPSVSEAERHPNGTVDARLNTSPSPSATSSAIPSRAADSTEGTSRNHEGALKPQSAVGEHDIWSSTLNGFNRPLGFGNLSQVGKGVISEATIMHSQATDMVIRTNSLTPMSQFNMDRGNLLAVPSTSSSSRTRLPDSNYDSQGAWKGLSPPNTKLSSFPPDLNVGFQSPGSPVSGVVLDSQNPNLSLQL
ncbi:hypothetical protein Cni_G08519 [Canna indica]|uniref:Bromo domain-containing protein n=1 Tax=Canna indica TaxID=4628 RepID=A0AAQ3K0W5_9LILI|nr:hypothetical protein Cni_G08519 [Canna indica]